MKNVLLIVCICFVSISSALAQNDLKFKFKETKEHPDVYIDGKKYDYDIVDMLDQSKIASASILSDDVAINKYNAPNGVILIVSIRATKEVDELDNDTVKNTVGLNLDPVVIIDGKVADKKALEDLSPNDIELVNVVKGQVAIDKYKALNGAVIVKTKKK